MVMTIEVGCKVRFLNEVGGGEVVKKVDARHWIVRTEDGFEIPMNVSELVVDSPPELVALSNSANQAKGTTVEADTTKVIAAKVQRERVQVQYSLSSPRKNAESLYLGFAPYDSQDVVKGPYLLYLINESPKEVLITLSRFEHSKCITFFGGRVARYSSRKVAEVTAKDLFLYTFLRIQALYYVIGAHELQEPFVSNVDINGNEFMRPRNFRSNRFMDEDLLLVAVHDQTKDRELEVLVERTTKDIEEIKAPVKESPKGEPAPEEVVVDLHFDALTQQGQNVKNMSPNEKLQFQLQYFRHAVEEAIATYHVKRLVAIHGVGSGALEKEVLRILRLEFPQCDYQDASFKEYGYGAKLIFIEHSKQ